mmetsp:Transcript_36548/g.48971  ORF Transcript_36548/g.48971 Transcript_36548/m.48971 type:complete len:145 (+) Transcript_36548:392-826(+)
MPPLIFRPIEWQPRWGRLLGELAEQYYGLVGDPLALVALLGVDDVGGEGEGGDIREVEEACTGVLEGTCMANPLQVHQDNVDVEVASAVHSVDKAVGYDAELDIDVADALHLDVDMDLLGAAPLADCKKVLPSQQLPADSGFPY